MRFSIRPMSCSSPLSLSVAHTYTREMERKRDVPGHVIAPQEPTAARVPHFTAAHAQLLAEHHFAITGTAFQLVSERDQNFHLVASDGTGAILKISSPSDGPDVISLQNQALLHVEQTDPTLPVMRLIRTTTGGFHADVEDPGGRIHTVRMLTYMPGHHLRAPDISAATWWHMGSQTARLGRALRSFFHPAAGRALVWDQQQLLTLRPLLAYIADPDQRQIIDRALDHFENNTAGLFSALRSQTIHNDLSLSNVLFGDDQRVTGILDFGDIVHTALICDLAVCAESVFESEHAIASLNAVVGGYDSITVLEDEEIRVLPDLLLARWSTLLLISAWQADKNPETGDYVRSWQAGPSAMLRVADEQGFREWSQTVRSSLRPARHPDSFDESGATIGELKERRRLRLGSAISPLSYENPLHLARGDGVWVSDASGRVYLDAYNNVPVVGHCNPRVVEAISRQASALNTNTRYLHSSVLRLADRLVSSMPPGLDTVLFVNSGSEANDLAWRLATAATGGTGGVVTKFAYHGVSSAVAELSPEGWPPNYAPDHVALLPAPDSYRGRYRSDSQDWPAKYAGHVADAIHQLCARGHKPAALLIDPGFTSDGVLTPPAEYLVDVARRWREAGGLLVADEVQVGFGRFGSRLWGFEAYGVIPDIVTIGKPMGNGHPVAAVVTRAEIVDAFAKRNSWFSTFGGNPVACEAALAVLDVIDELDLLAHTESVAALFRSQLDEIQDRHSVIGDVRSRGLLVGVELVQSKSSRLPLPAAGLANAMRERGVLVGTTGPHSNVLKIRPPLVIGPEEVRLLGDTLNVVLTEMAH